MSLSNNDYWVRNGTKRCEAVRKLAAPKSGGRAYIFPTSLELRTLMTFLQIPMRKRQLSKHSYCSYGGNADFSKNKNIAFLRNDKDFSNMEYIIPHGPRRLFLPSSPHYLGSLSWTSRTFYFPDSRDLLEVLGGLSWQRGRIP